MAYDAEIVGGSFGSGLGSLGFLQFFLSKSRCLQFFSSFRVLLVCKVKPRKTTNSFFCFLHFFSFVSARPHYYPAFWAGVILHLILRFSQKPPFLLQNGQFCFFSYLHCFSPVYQCFLHKHRPKSTDKPACTDPYCSYNAFSKINSKSIWQQCHVGSNPTVCAKEAVAQGKNPSAAASLRLNASRSTKNARHRPPNFQKADNSNRPF